MSQTRQQLSTRVIYFAMLFGLAAFGAAAFRFGGRPMEAPPEAMGWAAYAGTVVASTVILVLRTVRAPDARMPTNRAIVGYAVAEFAALLGAVYLFMGGPPWPYACGLTVFIIAGLLL